MSTPCARKLIPFTKWSSRHFREFNKDLFTSDEKYALAHCVAEDFYMGAGIALEFK